MRGLRVALPPPPGVLTGKGSWPPFLGRGAARWEDLGEGGLSCCLGFGAGSGEGGELLAPEVCLEDALQAPGPAPFRVRPVGHPQASVLSQGGGNKWGGQLE